jgi:hypothetical protein
VNDVEAHIAGARDAHNGVQVRAVVIEEPARFVRKPRDFKDIRITYRKEIKADEKDITCKYTEENGTHIVGIYGNNGTLRAIVALS